MDLPRCTRYDGSMSIYRFSATSTIAEARFHAVASPSPVALLAAADGAEQGKLDTLRLVMAAKGWQCVPVFTEGKERLQVTGFRDAAEMTALLYAQGMVAGSPQITAQAGDTMLPSARTHAKNYLQRNSLQIAGVLNLIGDVGFLGKGMNTQDRYKIAGGGLYTLGGLNLALFGKVKDHRPGDRLSAETAEFVRGKLGGLPDGTGLERAGEQQAGQPQGGQGFFERNAAQNTLVAYTGGAAAILASGVKKYRANPKETAGMYYGVSSLVFKLASLVIPEKRAEEGAEKKGGIINWVREKPLRLFGYGSVVTDSLLAYETYQDYKFHPGKKNYLWSAVTAVTYILADFMMAISNKDKSNAVEKLTGDQQLQITAMAAEVLVAQPEEKRQALAEDIGGFLAHRPEVKGSRGDIAKAILEQAQHMGTSRWTARTETATVAAEPSR